MTIRHTIRIWLGIGEVLTYCRNIQLAVDALARAQNNDVRIHNHALGRLIAKLDPIYGVSEHDPQRKADSDRIAADVLAKLSAELIATRRQGGEL